MQVYVMVAELNILEPLLPHTMQLVSLGLPPMLYSAEFPLRMQLTILGLLFWLLYIQPPL